MKNTLLLLALLFCSLAFGQSQNKKVLFIGNSYTYTNNLPQMVADAATSTGDTLLVDSYTLGGYFLYDHANGMMPLALW